MQMKIVTALILTILTFNVHAKLKVKFATVAPEGTPWADLLANIQKDVKKQSKGDILIKTYMSGQLGGEQEILQKLRRGNIQGAGLSTASLSTVIPEIDVIELPYLFESYEEADYVLDNKLFKPFKEIFAKKGLVLVTWSENGFRNMGHKTKPILVPEDVTGEKMRSQVSDVHLGFYKKLGAAPQAMSTTEVLSALQTGVVQGFDNTPLFTMAAEWHTAIKHYTLTKHIYQAGVVVFSDKLWKKASEDERKILYGKGNDLAPESRIAIRAMDKEIVDALKSTGVTVHDLSSKQTAKFKEKLAGLHAELVKKIGGDAQKIYDLILEGKKEFAAR